MAVFRRRETPPGPFQHYSEYRPYVREDFSECCAYCLLSEFWRAGRENFELDHFRPKSLPQFAHLVNDFYNLYYACHPCNHIKGNRWPDLDKEAQGYGFLDLCAEKFSNHFEEDEKGFWRPLSLRGIYTLERLNLNKGHLVEIRGKLRILAARKGRPPIDWNHPAREQIQVLLD